MKPIDHAFAKTEAAALRAASHGWTIKAGGIDLLDRLKERDTEQTRLVSILRLEGMRGIEEHAGGLRIGPLATLRDVADSALARRLFPALAQSAGEAATPQIRAVATMGGNLCQRPRCWYFRSKDFPCTKKGGSTCYAVDGENAFHALFGGGPCHIVHPSNVAPPLMAAGARFVVKGASGERTIDAEDFFVLPRQSVYAENVLSEGEMIARIDVPEPPSRSAWVQLKQRQSFDWPLAACAAARTAQGWRVVLGAVAPVPWIPAKANALLANAAEITPQLAEQAAEAALDGAVPMSQNAWRLALVRAAVRRALLLADGKDID